MSNSPLGYYLPRDESLYAATRPVSTGNAYALANNVAHLCDESGQVLVNWGSLTKFVRADGDTGNTEWRFCARYGPFPITVQSGNAAPFKCRVRVLMSVGSDEYPSGGSVRVVVGPLSSQSYDANSSPLAPNVVQFTTASETVAAQSGLLYLPGSRLLDIITPINTVNADGNPESILIPQVYVDVWSRDEGAGTNADPLVWGLYVAEYVGT